MIEKLLETIGQIWQLFLPWYVINEYEKGVVLRFGKWNREIGPGFHWLIPLGVDRVQADNVVFRTMDLPAQSLTTVDDINVVVSAVVTAKIRNIKKALLEVEGADDAIKDACVGTIGELVSASTWDELRQPKFQERLATACHERATGWGFDIKSARLSDLTKASTLRIAGMVNAK